MLTVNTQIYLFISWCVNAPAAFLLPLLLVKHDSALAICLCNDFAVQVQVMKLSLSDETLPI